MELRWHEDGVSVKCGADGLEDGEAILATGTDDGTDGGEELAEVGKRWSVSHLYLDSHSRSSIKENQHLGIKLAKNTIRRADRRTPGEQLRHFRCRVGRRPPHQYRTSPPAKPTKARGGMNIVLGG